MMNGSHSARARGLGIVLGLMVTVVAGCQGMASGGGSLLIEPKGALLLNLSGDGNAIEITNGSAGLVQAEMIGEAGRIESDVTIAPGGRVRLRVESLRSIRLENAATAAAEVGYRVFGGRVEIETDPMLPPDEE